MNNIKSNVEVLSQNEIEKIHENTLKVLANTGIKVPHEECLRACEKLGAIIDVDTQVVKIPVKVMEEIIVDLKKVKRNTEEKKNELKGNISTQLFIVDYVNNNRREGDLDDLLKGIILVEELDNIAAANAVIIPSDVPSNMTDIISFQQIFTYSTKPGGTYVLSPEGAKYIIEMGKIMGRKEGYMLETVSPLQFRKENLDIAMVYAREGLYLGLGPMVMGGASSPVTIAATLTVQNAEVLGSIFLIYALTGSFSGYSSPSHTMDLRTTLCSFGSPNQALLGIASTQLANYYGLKCFSNSGLTDSLIPDFQGGFEKGANAIFSMLAGAGGMGAQGIVGADQGYSHEQLVIDNEWIDFYNYVNQGIEVNEDTLALDLIEEIGIGGNFLAADHTLKHMRTAYWNSNLFSRDFWDSWEENGKRTVYDKAHDYVEKVVKDYKKIEPVIDSAKVDAINKIVANAHEELN